MIYLKKWVVVLLLMPLLSLAQTDVLHYQIDLGIRNMATKSIIGSTKIKLITTQSASVIKFNLLKLNVSKVLYKGEMLNFLQNDSILTINLPNMRNAGDTLELSVFYNGNPVADKTWGGFYFSGNYAFNMGVAFSSIPHNFGRCWFPCIDNFTDRAFYDFNITTDYGYKALCNGLLINQQLNTDSSVTYSWKLNQSIPTYLANVAVGRYTFIIDTFVSGNKNIPILIAVEPKDSLNAAKSMVNLKQAAACFEAKFGPYLFDRIGYVAVPFSAGAMEHAANISYPIYALDGTLNFETLMAHELSHMWFGNLTTCETSSDMWLNEGWASFCEAEFLHCLYGSDAYKNEIEDKQFESFRFAHVRDNGYKAISGVTNDITYGTHVYKKGALAAYNLKEILGDSLFYMACKNYLKTYRFNHANSNNLLSEMQKYTTADLTDYFKNWIFDRGNYNVVFNQLKTAKNYIKFGLVQQKKHATDFLKNIPITVTVYNNKMQQLNYTYNLNNTLNDVLINFGFDFNPAFATINYRQSFALAKTTEIQTIKKTGVINFNKTLLTVSVKSNTDSAIIYTEHNFTAPFQFEVLPENIRISTDRYWRIDGIWNSNFSATAFLNYDGSKPLTKTAGYLDNELFEHILTEDSLVLLYRENAVSKWQMHTDNTLQTGPSKTDFTGRFWLNNLQKGEYAFGVKDAKTSVKKIPANKINLYPNPSSKEIFIEGNFHNLFTYTICNLSGQIKQSGTLFNNTINISKIENGFYVLYLTDNATYLHTNFIINR